MSQQSPRHSEPEDPVGLLRRRSSAFLLAAANLYVAFPVVISNWSLPELMWTYWLQSVIIGVFQFLKILSLSGFEPGDFRILGRPARNTRLTKIFLAAFFLFHYGFMHFVFMLFMAWNFDVLPAQIAGFLVAGLIFALTHLFSFAKHRPALQRSKPEIGTLFFAPYVRIVPMHLTMLLGFGFAGLLSGGGTGVTVTILFVLLKTVADIAMHVREH